jgi:hypothetical protein
LVETGYAVWCGLPGAEEGGELGSGAVNEGDACVGEDFLSAGDEFWAEAFAAAV